MIELMVMVGLISLVTIPIMYFYSTFGALGVYPGYEYNMYSLGNIGGASAFCTQATFMPDATAFQIRCPMGTLIDTQAVAHNTGRPMFEAGLISIDAEVNTYCTNSVTDGHSPGKCSAYLNRDRLAESLN